MIKNLAYNIYRVFNPGFPYYRIFYNVEDVRSKKVLLVSHCILNQNSVSDGTAEYPGINEIIIKKLLHANIGIIQLPCPEIMCLGLDRRNIHGGEKQVEVENTRIRKELEKKDSIRLIYDLVEQIILQINEYIKNGFSILGIIGVNRSPSMIQCI